MLKTYYVAGKGYRISENSNSTYLAFILNENSVVYYGCQTEEITPNIYFGNIKELLYTFSKIRIIGIFLGEMTQDSNLISAIRNIPHYRIPTNSYHISSYLSAAKVTVEVGETVLFLIHSRRYCIWELKFTSDGYQIIEERSVYSNESNYHTLKAIYGSSNPKVIVLANTYPKIPDEKLSNILEGKNVIKVDKQISDCTQIFIAEMGKWLFDKTYIKYFILPYCNREFVIFNKNDSEKKPLITVKEYETLPLKKSCIVSKIELQLLTINDSEYASIIENIPVPNEGHRFKIYFSVDANSNPHWEVESIDLTEIAIMPAILKIYPKAIHPVICIFDNTSVIYVSKSKKQINYECLQSWNGLYGNELIISFTDEKPKIGLKAMKDLQKKPEFVIYDLIEIMAMPEDDIRMDNSWGFKIKDGIDISHLIQFQNFNGKLELTLPESSFAYLLKKHLNAIKATIGVKPNKLYFYLFKNFTFDEKQRVEKKIKEACKMLNIECDFFYFCLK